MPNGTTLQNIKTWKLLLLSSLLSLLSLLLLHPYFSMKIFYGYCVTTLCVTSQDYSSALGMVICDFHGNINLIHCSSRAEASVGIIIMDLYLYFRNGWDYSYIYTTRLHIC